MEAKGNHAAATVYLDKLAEELTNRGLDAWLMAPPGRVPSVYITNPAARALEENVYADRGKDGLWWFWWSWAERISIADDLDAAATTITHVWISPGDDPPHGGTRLPYLPPAPGDPRLGGLQPALEPPGRQHDRVSLPVISTANDTQ